MSVRIYVQKNRTGAVWSTVMPESGVWRKESMGYQYTDSSQPIGAVTHNFYPDRGRNRNRFTYL